MNQLLRKFRDETKEAVLGLLWRQWCSLGVAGHAGQANPEYLIDPEALVLATSSIGVLEPRLFDEALDWLGSFGALINLQRLKNIRKATSLGDEQVLSAMAEWLVTHAGQPRWKTLIQRRPKDAPERMLFIESGSIRPRDPDPVFLRNGLSRACFQARNMSRTPDPLLPPNLLFSMRALIGVGARAEVILYLAGGSPTHASEIARATHYSPRTMQALLQEMALSGHLLTQGASSSSTGKIRRGANRRYLVNPQNWSFLVNGQPFPCWFPWPNLYALGSRIVTLLPDHPKKMEHPIVLVSKLRDAALLYQQSRFYLRSGGAYSPPVDTSGEDLLASLSEHFPSAVRSM